jgi:hypothetical protein
MKKSKVYQQPICKNQAVCEESHYIYKKGFIDHRPARGINEDTKIARGDREIFNFYYCQNFRCNRLEFHPTTVEFRVLEFKKLKSFVLFSFDITRNRLFFNLLDTNKDAEVVSLMYMKLMELYTVETVIVDPKYQDQLYGPWKIKTDYLTTNLSLIDSIQNYLNENPHLNINTTLIYLSNEYHYRLPEQKKARDKQFDKLKKEFGKINFEIDEVEDE